MTNIVTWAREFWDREKVTNREVVLSKNRLYIIKAEPGGFTVNSAGFKKLYPTLSAAAKEVRADWQLVDAVIAKDKFNTALVCVREDGTVAIH
jgi:hypothetical protein